MVRSSKILAGVSFMLLAVSAPSQAGNLVYTPTNPAFNSNSLSGSYLLGTADVQNIPKSRKNRLSALQSLATSQALGQNNASSSLQSLILAQVSNRITNVILGAGTNGNPLSGTFLVGSATLSYQRTGNLVNITITDGLTTTVVQVPVI